MITHDVQANEAAAPARCASAVDTDRRACVGEPDGVRVVATAGPITDACVLHAAVAVASQGHHRTRIATGGQTGAARAAFLLSRELDRSWWFEAAARDRAVQLYRAHVEGQADEPATDTGRICETCARLWSGTGDHCHDCLTAHEDAQEAAVPLDTAEAATATGLEDWQWKTAVALGLIPAADTSRSGTACWSRPVVEAVAAQAEQVTAAVGHDRPRGATRTADAIAERLDREVGYDDIDALVWAGTLTVVGTFKTYDLYATGQADTITPDDLAAARAASLSIHEAATLAGPEWIEPEFLAACRQLGIEPGVRDRFDRHAIAAVTGTGERVEELAGQRRVGPDQAAEHLEIRRADFDALVDAGLAVQAGRTTRAVGRYSEVTVPLYRVGDLDGLRDHPDIDWEAVRAVKPGAPSPIRELAPKRPDRAAVVKAFARRVKDAHPGMEVWLAYHGGAQEWRLDWSDDAIAAEAITAMLADDPATKYRREIRIGTRAGGVARWARRMLTPGVAVVVDTETTDLYGHIVQIGVVDPATGQTLLNSYVDPAGRAITVEARGVHGITDAQLVDAPAWSKVLAKLRKVTKDRQIVAFNAGFDAGRVLQHTAAVGCKPLHLAEDGRWECAQAAYMDWVGTSRLLALYGPHDAVGDCRAVVDLLHRLSTPPDARPVTGSKRLAGAKT